MSEAVEEPDLTAGGTLPAVWARNSEKNPDTIVIVGGTGGTLTAVALEESSRRIARRMRGAGLVPGDRVLISAESSMELVVALVATLRAGLTVVPANTAYRSRELAHIVNDAAPALAILDDGARARDVEAAGAAHGMSLAVTGTGVDLPDPPSSETFDVDAAAPGDIALIAYTSGTTGTPKGAMLTHINLLANAASIAQAWRWTGDDRLLLTLPLFHGHGLCNGLFGTLYAGGSLVVMGGFDAARVCGAIEERSATLFFGVPTMYHRLLAHPGVGEMAKLRLCVSGSAALPAATFAAFAAATGQRPLERYGATEVLMAISNPYDGERRPGSVGIPLPGVEIRLALPSGEAREADETGGAGGAGEILVRSPMVFAGYRNLPDATAQAMGGEWFRTGDLASTAPDGYVTIRGRTKELIITGGLNVYPREVEEVIATHPAVAEVAVVGIPSGEWGERVTAFVVTDGTAARDNELARTITAHAAAGLAPYKCPKEVRFVDSLPRNALGKVVKHLLVE